jgi:CIC family chloride channel protein
MQFPSSPQPSPLTTQAIIGAPYDITAPAVAPLTFLDYVALTGLGLFAAVVGVAAMHVAALIERAFCWAIPWRLIRPMVGGLMVGAMALSPQVLGRRAMARSGSTSTGLWAHGTS